MELRVIRTDAEHRRALARIDALFDAPARSPQADELEVLALLVETYEQTRWPVELPDAVEAIAFRMDQQGLTRKDLEPYLGTRARVSEVMTRKRSLSLAMIQRLHEGLGIPLEALIPRARPKRVTARRAGRIDSTKKLKRRA